jgi:hypothetical protein
VIDDDGVGPRRRAEPKQNHFADSHEGRDVARHTTDQQRDADPA